MQVTTPFLVNVQKLEDVKKIEKVGIKTFLFALQGFSVGYPKTFKVSDIPTHIDAYLLVNRILDCQDIDRLKEILKSISTKIKGIVFEDIGIYNMAVEMGFEGELILWQNHFGTNKSSINFYLKRGVDGVFIASDLEESEINTILCEVNGPVVLPIFGHNQIAYSRRKLLSNYAEHFCLPRSKMAIMKEKIGALNLIVCENEYGTVIYNKMAYNAWRMYGKNNVKYYFVDTVFLNIKAVISMIQSFGEQLDNIEYDYGFLDQKTFYRLENKE